MLYNEAQKGARFPSHQHKAMASSSAAHRENFFQFAHMHTFCAVALRARTVLDSDEFFLSQGAIALTHVLTHSRFSLYAFIIWADEKSLSSLTQTGAARD
jgi:hypothetical protein